MTIARCRLKLAAMTNEASFSHIYIFSLVLHALCTGRRHIAPPPPSVPPFTKLDYSIDTIWAIQRRTLLLRHSPITTSRHTARRMPPEKFTYFRLPPHCTAHQKRRSLIFADFRVGRRDGRAGCPRAAMMPEVPPRRLHRSHYASMPFQLLFLMPPRRCPLEYHQLISRYHATF